MAMVTQHRFASTAQTSMTMVAKQSGFLFKPVRILCVLRYAQMLSIFGMLKKFNKLNTKPQNIAELQKVALTLNDL